MRQVINNISFVIKNKIFRQSSIVKCQLSNVKCHVSDVRCNKGFTLLEFILAIAIMLAMAGGGIALYGQLYASSQLNESAIQMIQTIRIARERGVARVNDVAHGVYFDAVAKKYTLYQGSSWADVGKVIIRETTLDSSLSLTISLGGAGDTNDLNFSKGLGEPNRTGNITLAHAGGNTKIINVNSFGKTDLSI